MEKRGLYPFQRAALESLADFDSVLLAWQMGTGKTTGARILAERYESRILVIVGPKSLADQWAEEIETQTDRHAYSAYKAKGVQKFLEDSERKAIFIGYDFYKLKSQESLRKFLKKNADDLTMILDESSLLGNIKSARTKAIMKTDAAHKIFLSGTPASGGKMESMLPTFWMLGWRISRDAFFNRYCICTTYTNPQTSWITIKRPIGYKNLPELRAEMQRYGTSFVTMQQAGIDLPETCEIPIVCAPHPVYRRFMQDGVAEVDGQEIIGDCTLTKLIRARQLCSTYSKDKAARFKDLLQQADGERVICFYNFSDELEQMKKICGKLDRPVSIVNGSGKDLTAYETKADSVTLIQYQAGAMGLNLQKGRISIFYSPCLSYSDFDQAKARTHRIGQNRGCTFYLLSCPGTVEEDIYATLAQRRDYSKQLFEEKYGKSDDVAGSCNRKK